jgi:benzaldehyde dehydrogenase (NAD)
MGPVVDMKTVTRCNALIDDALAKGARLLTGGKADTTQMRATLLDGVTRSMRIWQEESFGPVKAIIRVQDEQEALAVANESEYGLSSAVYSRDTARAWNVAQSCKPAFATLMAPPCTMKRRCRLAAAKLPATDALAAAQVLLNLPSCAG